jgi:RNA polymerase sigma-70 factor (ECF subfamily)
MMNEICWNAIAWTGSFELQGLTLPASLRGLVLASVKPCEQDGPRDRTESDAQTDWPDIRASLDGDGEAFARLVQRYQQPVAVYLWRFTRQRRVWEELVQDVFVEAFLSLRTYRADAPLLHWLKRIATRVGYRHWRNRQGRRRELSISEAEAVTDADQANASFRYEAGELVYSLLSRLSPRDRLVMTLVYLEECSTREIAELTGWSESLVKVQTYRARKRLKKLCDREGIDL